MEMYVGRGDSCERVEGGRVSGKKGVRKERREGLRIVGDGERERQREKQRDQRDRDREMKLEDQWHQNQWSASGAC